MTQVKKNFIQRVLEAITGSDESKVTRFQKIAIKEAEQQVKLREGKKEELNDRIADAEESLNAYLESIPMDKIGTGDEARAFSKNYIDQYMLKTSKIDAMKDELETLDLEIKAYNEFISKLK